MIVAEKVDVLGGGNRKKRGASVYESERVGRSAETGVIDCAGVDIHEVELIGGSQREGAILCILGSEGHVWFSKSESGLFCSSVEGKRERASINDASRLQDVQNIGRVIQRSESQDALSHYSTQIGLLHHR